MIMNAYPNIKENIEIKGVIGSGGTAVVYDAWDKWAKKRVAVKALYKSRMSDKHIIEKFKQEANLYLYLEHPNIAKLKDFIETPESYYIVMEYIEGKNLDEYISTVSGPIVGENLSIIFKQVLRAVAHAHHNNVCHLDLKPSNIMIDNNKQVKVLDFGISHSAENKIENIKRRMGTPIYMSPEQVTMSQITRHSDIYSLGVTLYHAVTATLPYKGNFSLDEIFNKIKFENLPKIKEIYPFNSVKLQYIIEKATEKDINKRFQSCEEFEYFLEKALRNDN